MISRRLGLGLALLAAVPACGGGGSPSGDRVAAGWTAYRDAGAGLRVQFPSDWARARRSLTPALVAPVEILSVGTGPMGRRRGRCAQFPVGALEAMGRADAFVTLQERRAPDGSQRVQPTRRPPRPEHFRLGRPDTSEVIACLRERRRPRTWWLSFTDSGRGFYALVALGRDVSSARRAEALTLLDSLIFDSWSRDRGAREGG